MKVLFIHGMGRTPLSGWGLLRKLRLSGVATSSFGYATAMQNFAQISSRLSSRILKLSGDGEYILIGHSLGGVLLRSALAALPVGARLPSRVFLLGSPTKPARLAQSLSRNLVYRLATGDCGQLLASDSRMQAVPPLAVPTTSIRGNRGIALTSRAFGAEINDGVVAGSETSAAWITEVFLVPVLHTLLPSSAQVAKIILKKIREAPLVTRT